MLRRTRLTCMISTRALCSCGRMPGEEYFGSQFLMVLRTRAAEMGSLVVMGSETSAPHIWEITKQKTGLESRAGP